MTSSVFRRADPSDREEGAQRPCSDADATLTCPLPRLQMPSLCGFSDPHRLRAKEVVHWPKGCRFGFSARSKCGGTASRSPWERRSNGLCWRSCF
jgi:hypothetical protein